MISALKMLRSVLNEEKSKEKWDYEQKTLE